MTDRVKERDLQNLVDRINRLTGSPAEPYTWGSGSNVGNYHLDFAYGGVKLARMVNTSGGITNPLGGGYKTKRELYTQLDAFILGLEK